MQLGRDGEFAKDKVKNLFYISLDFEIVSARAKMFWYTQ